MAKKHITANRFKTSERIVVYHGDCLKLIKQIPDKKIQLVVTSPPYNIGKEYEKRIELDEYLSQQTKVIKECVRILSPRGSICWQVGNYVNNGSIIPLDSLLYRIFDDQGLKLRNRIIWHFGHGLHCNKRFSGRYETINWFTKSDNYTFHLDPVRIPQKYPGKKYFKGPNAGKYSCNPKGKNPSDVWEIPNVKSNHVEKTVHPCQFPVELIERLVLSLTNKDDWIFDPFLGTGTSIIAAIKHERRGSGAEIEDKYIRIAKNRISQESKGTLQTRPMNKPVFDPKNAGNNLLEAPWQKESKISQLTLFDKNKQSRRQ